MPNGPRKFDFSFERAGLTRFGGLCLFQACCKSLGLRHFLQLYVRWPQYPHRDCHPADLFLAHVFALVAGLGRIENTQCLLPKGLIPPLVGLPEFPHRDTLRTVLWRFGPPELQSLEAAHDRLRQALCPRTGVQYSAIVDADTTALLVFGSQEGAAVGDVPKRRHGKPSSAPLLASEGRTGWSLGLALRAGNVHSATGAWGFLERMRATLPASIAVTRTRVRLDGAFYDKAITHALAADRLGYVIVARMTAPLRARMVAARSHEFARGWEAAVFAYTPFPEKDEHRFIAVRRPAALEPEDIQRRLFTFKRSTYHRALVTTLDLTPPAASRSCCSASCRGPMPWRRSPPGASGPTPPTCKASSGPTIWSWRSNSCVCRRQSNTGISPRCVASCGGCPLTGCGGGIATCWSCRRAIPGKSAFGKSGTPPPEFGRFFDPICNTSEGFPRRGDVKVSRDSGIQNSSRCGRRPSRPGPVGTASPPPPLSMHQLPAPGRHTRRQIDNDASTLAPSLSSKISPLSEPGEGGQTSPCRS